MREEVHSSTVKDIYRHLHNIINVKRSVALGFKELLNNNNQNNSIMLPYEVLGREHRPLPLNLMLKNSVEI